MSWTLTNKLLLLLSSFKCYFSISEMISDDCFTNWRSYAGFEATTLSHLQIGRHLKGSRLTESHSAGPPSMLSWDTSESSE